MSRTFDLSQRGYHSRNKNAVINGALEIWQRGTSFVSPTDGTYTADRWLLGLAGTAAFTISRSTDVPTVSEAGILAPYSLLVDVTTADASVAAGDIVAIQTRIEGYVWRNYAQRALTLSFWVKAPKTGTYSVGLKNSGVDRSYVAEYTVSVADTWEKKQVQFSASPSAGTWDYTNGVGVYLNFVLMAGTNFQGTTGSWQSGNITASASQVNAADSTANNFRLALVQLEVGDEATAFETVTFAEELLRCERYYAIQRYYVDGEMVAGSEILGFPHNYRVLMRDTPTITRTSVSSANVASFSSTAGTASNQGFLGQWQSTAAGRMFDLGTITLSAEL